MRNMKLFTGLYQWAMRVIESIFFPIPPDIILIPMVVAKPYRAYALAALTTVCSVLGGVLGYLLGMWAFHWIEPWVQAVGYADTMAHVRQLYEQSGVWVVIIAGFTPIPYKIFTITSGVMSMDIASFIFASLVGRGGRFFLEAILLKRYGNSFANSVGPYMESIGWGTVVVATLAYWFH
jgi:membrane protein YqaA with SNARE-associated domain